jgi:uncharacterized membrane protein
LPPVASSEASEDLGASLGIGVASAAAVLLIGGCLCKRRVLHKRLWRRHESLSFHVQSDKNAQLPSDHGAPVPAPAQPVPAPVTLSQRANVEQALLPPPSGVVPPSRMLAPPADALPAPSRLPAPMAPPPQNTFGADHGTGGPAADPTAGGHALIGPTAFV